MKIQANDLRVGNWIYDAECAPHYFQVECIYQNLHGKYWVSYRDESIKSDIGEVVPIKLTEEILLKCGFEESSIDYDDLKLSMIHRDGKYSANLDHEGVWFFGYGYEDYCTEIKHLHQLQNLYYALCGEELTVKL